jgi:tRNA-dihydrouridine synthase
MLNAGAFDERKRQDLIDWVRYPHRISLSSSVGNREIDPAQLDRPLIVQLAGHDPPTLVEAGRYFQHDVTAIDLNLGCPQHIAKRGNYGAFLLPQTDKVIEILSYMVENLDAPITAKIRLLPSDDETIDLCRRMEAVGVSMITVHGRDRKQNKQLVGQADWDMIRRIKGSVSIPVLANGGIETCDDVTRCFDCTGVDGVMSSEAILENPGIFDREYSMKLNNSFVETQLDIASDYLGIVEAFGASNCGLSRQTGSFVKAHMFKLLHRFLSLPAFFDVRDALGATKCIETTRAILDGLRLRVADVQNRVETAAHPLRSGALFDGSFLHPDSSWYRRHRKAKIFARTLPEQCN